MNAMFLATPIRSATSQENVVGPKKSQTSTGHHHKSLKASSSLTGTNGGNNNMQDMSARKKLGQFSNSHRMFNTPMAPRTKLGTVSTNTPIGGSWKQSKGAHHKEESFVKPLNFTTGGNTADCKKASTTCHGVAATRPTLPTVYEEIENMYPMSKKMLREDIDPCMADDGKIFDPYPSLCHSDDDDSQKENRRLTVDELCDLF